MNARNFDKLMCEEIERHRGKKLLLHCCCAPCSSACLERLKDDFAITVLFYNPNIESAEYLRRKDELIRLIKTTGWADFIDCDYEGEKFYSAVKGLEKEKEGGKRCEVCFKLRLEKTAEIAKTNGFDLFTTTLTVSPLKNAQLINEIGESLQSGKALWLHSDFKKRNGYLRSCELSKQYNLYRQDFCGCVYSERDKKLVENK
ncbi:MAG: epoxyqueuosine reductase QueH [Clostridia bacterium]|nr:epoxyqueuosine reductase QueH [Clostridia bacterium]